MIFDFEPGDKVFNPANKDWGIGQVQSIIKGKITVNFQNVGKKVLNSNNIELKMYAKGTFQGVKDFVEWDIVAPPLTKMYKNVETKNHIVP